MVETNRALLLLSVQLPLLLDNANKTQLDVSISLWTSPSPPTMGVAIPNLDYYSDLCNVETNKKKDYRICVAVCPHPFDICHPSHSTTT